MDTPTHIRRLEDRIDQLETRFDQLETWLSLAERSPGADPTREAVAEAVGALQQRTAPRGATLHPDAQGSQPRQGGGAVGVQRPEAARANFAFNAERALKWAGVTLVFLAVAFAMNIAIDRGWLTPPVRVAGGILVALGLVGGGLVIHERRRLFAQTLEGAGLAVSFLTFFGGHQVLDVLPYPVSFAGMVVTTVAAFALAIRQGQSTLAVIGLLGGLATPLVLNLGDVGVDSGGGSLAGLATYTAILSVAALVIYFREGWGSLLVATGVLSAGAMAITVAQLGTSPSLSDQIAVQLMIVVVGAAAWVAATARATLGLPQRARLFVSLFDELFANVEYRFGSLVPVAAVLGSYPIWDTSQTEWGWITIVGGLAVAVVAYLLWSASQPMALSHIGSAAMLIVIGSGLVFDGPALVLVFAIQAATLFILAERLDDDVMLVGAAIVGGLTAVLFVADVAQVLEAPSAIEWQTAVFHALALGVAFATAFAAADVNVQRVLGLAAYVGTLVWLVELLQHLEQSQAFISVAWALVALITVGAAVRLRQASTFKLGLATLGLVVAKLILVDMAAVDTVWRVAVFFATGTALLAIGYRMPALWRTLVGEDEADHGASTPAVGG